MQNKKNIENKKNFDAEGKFDARWDDKLKFFFKVPYVWLSSQSRGQVIKGSEEKLDHPPPSNQTTRS